MNVITLTAIIVISFLFGYVIGEIKREIEQFYDEWFNKK